MSFYKSLQQLWIKLEQKNVVICSGNVNEIICDELKSYKETSPLTTEKTSQCKGEFTNVVNHLCETAKSLDFKVIKYLSPNIGIVDYLNQGQLEDTNEEKGKDEFGFNDNTAQQVASLESFIQNINNDIKTIRNDKNEDYKNLYIIECSDVLLDRSSQVPSIQIASLVESFVQFTKQNPSKFHKNKIKLVILARSTDTINKLISKNNTEFASITLLKPNKDEREEFYNRYKSKFNCLKETAKDNNHIDYREVITLSDGMSFREMFQYAKIDPNAVPQLSELTFKELYNLVTFNKTESEWEKIDFNKMKDIDEILTKRVKGQDYAINCAKKTLVRSFTGMNGVLHSTSNNRKPKGVLFLVGPTGTGKTELAKSISEFVFGEENRIIRFDMSEFGHEHSDQRLIGAPPGYVGYDAGGELTNAVKEKPFSILLFDEIEKANGKILDKFLQILEDGRLTSSQGEIIDFSETFIIFTSNIGVKNYTGDKNDNKKVREHFILEVKNHFTNELGRPEILNRIGLKNIIPFNFITDETIIGNIVMSKLEKLEDFIKSEKHIQLHFENNTKNLISQEVIKKADKSMGGRGIITELETVFIDELSNFIFEYYNKIQENRTNNKLTTININYDGKIKFSIQ